MLRALLGGGGGRDDSSSRSSRRKSTAGGGDESRSSSRRHSKRSSASNVSVSSSRRSARGDDRDRDRGLGDISAARSETGDSTTTYVTAEPQSYAEEPVIIERTPRYVDRDDGAPRTSRSTTDRDSKKKERRDTDREGERARTRTRSGDNVTPSALSSSSRYAPASPGNTAADIGQPSFNQFPTQYDTPNMPATSVPFRPPLDSHISQQFPGQLPDTTSQPYIPPNPAGLAADYYGDQGQSVAHQPGVRPHAPDIIVGAQPHLQPASPMANPPPEPSSLGQVGAAAEYYAGGDSAVSSSTMTTTTTTATTVRPPRPGKPSKPSSRPPQPTSGASVPGESATYGIGSELFNQASSSYPATSVGQSRPPALGLAGPVPSQSGSSSNQGIGLALGGAAAGAAAAYMINHHDQSNSNAQHTTQPNHHNDSYGIGIPTQNGNINTSSEGNVGPYMGSGYADRPPLRPPSYSSGVMQPGTLAYHQRHHSPFSAFIDFWRDPEGVGKFEDYTEAIGVCRYCFEPGTTSKDAPRKHHYRQRRRSPVVERYGSSSRVDKLTRYTSSEDESRRKKSRGSSWLAAGLTGGLAGYVAKSLFSSKDFEETYSVKSGDRVDYSRRTAYDEGSAVSSGKGSATSRGFISRKSMSDDKVLVTQDSKSYRYSRRSSRSTSRSRSRDRRGASTLKEAAIGAAVGSALSVAAAQSSQRNRSRSRSATRPRRRTSDSSGSFYAERQRRRGRSSPEGFRSFFTAPSANRRKKYSKKKRGFFSLWNSSSSSGDFDLAFGGSELHGSTVSGRSSGSSRSSKRRNIDAEILGLGVAATQLARSSSRKEISPRDLVRPSSSKRMQMEDDEWEDADSSDSTVSENLAYGVSPQFLRRESVASGSSFWPWNSRKQDKERKHLDQASAAPRTNENIPYRAEYGSNDGSGSSKGSLQQVYPVPTNDPSRFDVVRMSTSSSPDAQPALVRPGPIPLQQPQPFTPVSQSVYYPATTAPVSPDMPIRTGPEESSIRDISRPRRSNSSPVLPLVPVDGGPSPGILKRRSTAKDPATVTFDLTEEQADRQQEVDRRNRERRDRRQDDFAVLREEAEDLERRREYKERKREERRRREEAEAEEKARKTQREKRRKDLEAEESMRKLQDVPPQTYDRREPEPSSWVTPTVIGAGAVAVAGIVAEKSFEDTRQSRFEERREKRRSQRRTASETQPEVTEVTRQDDNRQAIDEDEKRRRIAKIAASRIAQDANTSPVYDSYQEFFLPEELRHHKDHDSPSPDIIGKDSSSGQASRTVEPYLASDTEKSNSSWPPLVINIIQPTPPASHDGSVRDVHSPVPTSVPSQKAAPPDEVEQKPSRSSTGSRVSWGEHHTHEYEVDVSLSDKEELFDEKSQYQETSVPDRHSEDTNIEVPIEDVPLPHQDDDSGHTATQSMPGSFDDDDDDDDDDVAFAATLAAGAEIAGFDPSVVTEDETYYRKAKLPETGPRDTYRAPAIESVEDLGDVIPGDPSQAMPFLAADKDTHEVESAYPSREVTGVSGENVVAEGRNLYHQLPDARIPDNAQSKSVLIGEYLEDTHGEDDSQDESQYVASSLTRGDSKESSSSKRSSRTRDDIDIGSEDFSRQDVSSEYSDIKQYQDRTSNGDDAGLDAGLKRVKSDAARDDWIEEQYKERRNRRTKRASTELLDDARSVAASAPGADEMEEYRSRKSSSRSKHEEADLDDDNRPVPDADDDGEKRRRRRHKRHSGVFDDSGSVASSPAKIDETREKRRDRESSVSKDQQYDQDKRAGGFISNLFSLKASSERSPSSGKHETRSEAGVDDGKSERRRKKRSSGGRTSSGDGLGELEVSRKASQSTVDLSQLGKKYDYEEDDDTQPSRRRSREQRRRDKYEEIVGSAHDASEKERFDVAESADDNDDENQSFLEMRPEMPQLDLSFRGSNSDNENGASGLATKEAQMETASPYGGVQNELQQVQQRLRSHSVSPSVAEKTFELAPRSRSRPSSPGFGEEQVSKPRRLSVLRTNDSPTAVPLHFRKPPTSPSGTKRVSVSSPGQSPISPRHGHRRPNSIEFKNVREIRPLWLVERHSSTKFDTEPEGPLPSLPSSKTSSRVPSVEDLREAYDENAVADLHIGGGPSYSLGRKQVDLRISTDQLPAEEDDFLNSQQATPIAETYNGKQFDPPPIKKEKPKYEFHSPSELLQDPGVYYDRQIPEPPESMEQLPSVAGSDVGEKETEGTREQVPADTERQLEGPISAASEENQWKNSSSGMASFLTGAGFASVVDAAVSAYVGSHDMDVKSSNNRELPVAEHQEPEPTKDVDDEISEGVSTEHVKQQEHAETAENLGNVLEPTVAAGASSHFPTATGNKADVSETHDEAHLSGQIFTGIVDASVAAAGKLALSHAESTQLDSPNDEAGLHADNSPKEKAEDPVAFTKEPIVEEPNVDAEETTEDATMQTTSSSKKQKKKDRKKKKKSKDPGLASEDNNEEGETAAIPAVGLDSPSLAPAEATAERPAPTEPVNENENQKFIEKEAALELEEISKTPSRQSLIDDTKENPQDFIPEAEAEQPMSTEEAETVITSAETDTRPSPSAEQDVKDTNKQAPDVVAQPGDEAFSPATPKSQKRKKNKKKSQSSSEPVVIETTPASPVDKSVGPSTAEEAQLLDQAEKPLSEVASMAMPPEQVDDVENEPGVYIVPQRETERGNKEESEKFMDAPQEPNFSEEQSPAVLATEQHSQILLRIAESEQQQQQQQSLDNVTEEAPTQEEATKMMAPNEKSEASQNAIDKLPETSELPQQTIIEEPTKEDPTLLQSEDLAVDELVGSSEVTTAQPSNNKEEEPLAPTQSGKKSKNKKKKKKGKSLSVDESPSEAPKEVFDTPQNQLESSAAPVEPAITQTEEATTMDKDKEVVGLELSSNSPDPEVSQLNGVGTQSKEIEEIHPEGQRLASDTLSARAEVPQKLDDVVVSENQEASIAPDFLDAPETGVESELRTDESIEVRQPDQPEESPVATPAQFEEAIEPEMSHIADIPINPVSSEALPLEQEAASFNKQPLEGNEVAESTIKEDGAPFPDEETTESALFTPAKSKKKKNKKVKRASVVEEPEATTKTGETGVSIPIEPEISGAVEQESPALIESSLMPIETTMPIPAESEPSAFAEPETTLAEAGATTSNDTRDSPSFVDAESSTKTEPTTATSKNVPVLESHEIPEQGDETTDLALSQPDLQREGDESTGKQSTPQALGELEQSRTGSTGSPAEAEVEDFKPADSKAKLKKDNKKDKKKKKTAEGLTLDDKPSDERINEDSSKLVEAVIPEDSVLKGSTPNEQSNLDDPKTEDVKKDNLESQVLEPLPEEAKNVNIGEDDPLSKETSKSKKKKDKKKKKAETTVALTLEEGPTDKLKNDDVTKAAEATFSGYLEEDESISIEVPNLDEQKGDSVKEESQRSQVPTDAHTDGPTEEVKPIDNAEDGSRSAETSKPKKKKDKKKKRAMEAPFLAEEQSDKPVTEDTNDIVETVAPEKAKQTESAPNEKPDADEQTPVTAVKDTDAESQPQGISAETVAQIPAEETQPIDPVEETSIQEPSKLKKKKDRKKKKAARAVPSEEEPDRPVTEDNTELAEIPAAEVPEQSNADEEKTDVKVNDNDRQLPEAPAEEIAKAIDDAEDAGDDISTRQSSNLDRKEDKIKEEAPEALVLGDVLSVDKPNNDVTGLAKIPAAESAVTEQVPNTQTEIPETSAEEVKAAEIPEDDGFQEPSKSKKRKDKKKNRQSNQLEASQDESTRDAAADAPEIAAAVESDPAVENIAEIKQEHNEDVITDFQGQEVVQDESLPLQQPENLEEEGAKSKATKSKKKKGKKNMSKDEPLPWGAEKATELEGQQDTVPSEQTASTDVPEPTESAKFLGPIVNANSTPDAEPAEPVTAAPESFDEPSKLELTELPEPVEAMNPTEEIKESTEPPATGEVETRKRTGSQPEEPIDIQLPGPAESEVDSQTPVETTEQDSLMSTVVTEPKYSEKVAEVTDPSEVAPLTEPKLADSDEPVETMKREIAQRVKAASVEAAIEPMEETESIKNGKELSRGPSSKKSKKKKKRDSILLDNTLPISSEQQDPLATTSAAENSNEVALEGPSREENFSELASTKEAHTQQERELQELESADPMDANAGSQNSSAAAAETTNLLTAKEKKENPSRLDLSVSEPDLAGADEGVDVQAPVEQSVKNDDQNQEQAVSDEVAVIGENRNEKNKGQSVNWEEDIIQAATEDEPKRELDNAEATKDLSQPPSATENIDSNPELHEIESAPQETPVEVDGKETFQSSDETHTDKKEKDFDWTDNMVSPQVQFQTEEFPSPVPSPTSDNREDNDQPRPSVDDIHSGEPVTTDTLPEDELSFIKQGSAKGTTQSTVHLQPIDQEAENVDWAPTKTAKGGKGKKKKNQKSISFVPNKFLVTEEESSTRTPVDADDRPAHPILPDVSIEQVGESPESLSDQDALVISESPPDFGAEREFEDVVSSKKKNKADTWSVADVGEVVDERDAASYNQGPVHPSSDVFGKKQSSVDNDEDQIQVNPKITSDVGAKDGSKDLVFVEAPSQNEFVLEEQPDIEVPAVSEAPGRKLSKKEKKKLKKGKKAVGFEAEGPTAISMENEHTETTSTKQIVGAMEENVDNKTAVSGDFFTVDNRPAEEERVLAEPIVNAKSQEKGVELDTEPTPSQQELFALKPSKKEKGKNKERTTEGVQEDKGMDVNSTAIGGQLDDAVATPVAAEEQDSNRGPAIEAVTGNDEPESAHISLDPFEMPEAVNDAITGFVSPTADLEGQRQDAGSAIQIRALEKEADIGVAASLFEDPPGPENAISRQSRQKQEVEKSKKDKEASQREDDNLKEAVEIQGKPDLERPAREENYDMESQLAEPGENKFSSWPSVEFGHDSDENFGKETQTLKEDESELERPQISTQDPQFMIGNFGADDVQNEARDLEPDKFAAGEAQSISSQHEDVDIAVKAAMAAAGFLPSSAAPKTSPGADKSTNIRYTGETTRTKDQVGVYEQSDSLNDTGRPPETADTNFKTTRGRSTTNKIANIFPGLERVTYRRPSAKSYGKQASDDLTVEERNPPPPESQLHDKILKTTTEVQPAHVSANEFTAPEIESTSKDRSSSLLFDSSPATRLEPTPDIMKGASSPKIRLRLSSGSLHRAKSIHGHHTGHTHGWHLDEELTPAKRASSQSPKPLRGEHMDISPPRTPLDPIKEHDGAHVSSRSPRLVIGEGAYVLERPDSRGSARSMRSLRKANRSSSDDLRAVASHDKKIGEVDDLPRAGRQEAGWAAPSATSRSHSQPPSGPQRTEEDNDDDDDLDRQRLENLPSSSTYDPVTDKGKRPLRGMTDVYEAWGETPSSPRSPTRPPSVRRRQSMQHLQELEVRLDQLISENRLLAAAKDEAERKLSRAGVARRKSDQALNSSNADLRDKEAEIARLTSSLEWMQSEVQRLTQENETLNATHVELTASHAREVDALRTRQIELATGMEGIVRDQIGAALAEKDAELRRLRDELAAARQTVQELQQQIVAATADDVLSIHDEDYFDNACQRLCQHVQQWVLRFSKHSDLRRCRPLAEVRDTNVADRFDNAILDGSDVDTILSDRVRRRDVFVAVVMAMIWEYIFTRYLFGMDRDQRQKLKALEKQLSEIGPRRAVAHWRALTLTLLAKRPSFAEQRAKDTEAVALEIMESLSQLLPPPQSAQSQLLESLRGVLRRAANLSIEMRTQRAEYVMLPPLQPEFDSQGDLARQVSFNASLMNERSGMYSSNEALEAQSTPVRLVLFPLVVKKGTDLGDGDEEIVVCPAQVLVAWPDNERPRERDRMSALGNRSVSSVVPSVDMGNMF